MDRPIGLGQIGLDWVRAKKPIGRWIDHIELFVGHGDPARENELCSSLEKCGVCIDHFCQSHPIMYLQHFHASNAEVQSLDPHRSPRQRCLGWVWGSWQRSRRVKWEWGGHTTAKQKKMFRAWPLCKERRQSRVKDFDGTHLPKLIHFAGIAVPMESENRLILPAGFHLALGSAWGGGGKVCTADWIAGTVASSV